MATLSHVLAWRIPGAGEPGGLMSVGSHRVGLNWSDLAAAELLFLILIHFLLSRVTSTMNFAFLALFSYFSLYYYITTFACLNDKLFTIMFFWALYTEWFHLVIYLFLASTVCFWGTAMPNYNLFNSLGLITHHDLFVHPFAGHFDWSQVFFLLSHLWCGWIPVFVNFFRTHRLRVTLLAPRVCLSTALLFSHY